VEPYWRIHMGGASEILVRLWCARLWETGSPLQAEAVWSDVRGYHFYIRDNDPSWNAYQLARAGAGIKLLRNIRRTLIGGRHRLENKPEWRALIREIEAYLKKPSTSLENAVDRFWDYLVSDLDDDDLDAEAEGEDIEIGRKKAALAKLKRWLARWKKLPESKKRPEFM
jgi:hypothetical protein